ncbi:MAG: hypothetical protein IAI48_08315 [Candidatus Eremiobacteraeota bacterium]|nr:hypothetical protein [Candidatus Eremiobacteraeota bacterium]
MNGTSRPDGAALRFLRWVIEPPARPQPVGMRVLRTTLRAIGWVVRALIGDGTGGPHG